MHVLCTVHEMQKTTKDEKRLRTIELSFQMVTFILKYTYYLILVNEKKYFPIYLYELFY